MLSVRPAALPPAAPHARSPLPSHAAPGSGACPAERASINHHETFGFADYIIKLLEATASEIGTMAEVFGETAGVGVRSALGTNQLPFKIAVEVEAVFELHSE